MKAWRKPRTCVVCGHVHEKPEQAKWSTDKAFCTWCSDSAPPLTRKLRRRPMRG